MGCRTPDFPSLRRRGRPQSASNMTTWINSQFPRPDFHRQVQRHYGLQDTGFPHHQDDLGCVRLAKLADQVVHRHGLGPQGVVPKEARRCERPAHPTLGIRCRFAPQDPSGPRGTVPGRRAASRRAGRGLGRGIGDVKLSSTRSMIRVAITRPLTVWHFRPGCRPPRPPRPARGGRGMSCGRARRGTAPPIRRGSGCGRCP